MNLTNVSYALLNDYPYWLVGAVLILSFALLYFSLTLSLFFVFNWSIKKGIAQKVSKFDLFKNQIRFELLRSSMSIVIFGLYGLLIVVCYRNEVVSMSFEYDYMLVVDLLILAIWNEVHFYLVHKLLHTRLFVEVHKVHHKSNVVTPFSTFSFHPLEALILGSVMILPMLVIEFEVMAPVLFPIYSLFFNILGHSNVKLIKKTGVIRTVETSTNHNNHHTKYHSNFGFASPIMDRLMRTNYKK